MSKSIEDRNQMFKKGPDAEEFKRMHDDNLVQLRKNKRNEHIAKKRAYGTESQTKAQDTAEYVDGIIRFDTSLVPEELGKLERRLLNNNLGVNERLNLLIDIIKNTYTGDILKHAVTTLRKVLSYEDANPINEVGESRVSKKLIDCMLCNDRQLQIEATWCITNLSTAQDLIVDQLISYDVVPALVKIVSEGQNTENLFLQAVWALGNLAGGTENHRQIVLNHNAGDLMLKTLSSSNSLPIDQLSTLVWSLSNLFKHKSPQTSSLFLEFLSVSFKLLSLDHEGILEDCLWAFAYALEEDTTKIQPLLNTGLGLRIVNLMAHDSYSIKNAALRVVGFILLGDQIQTQTLINYGVVDKLISLLSSSKSSLKKDAAWSLSNLCIGSTPQVDTIMTNPGVITMIALLNDPDNLIKMDAAYIFCNSLRVASNDIVINLLQFGILQNLCQLLDSQNAETVLVALESISQILKCGKRYMVDHSESMDRAFCLLDEIGGITRIEHLQSHQNPKIYMKTSEILKDSLEGEVINDSDIQPEDFEF